MSDFYAGNTCNCGNSSYTGSGYGMPGYGGSYYGSPDCYGGMYGPYSPTPRIRGGAALRRETNEPYGRRFQKHDQQSEPRSIPLSARFSNWLFWTKHNISWKMSKVKKRR